MSKKERRYKISCSCDGIFFNAVYSTRSHSVMLICSKCGKKMRIYPKNLEKLKKKFKPIRTDKARLKKMG